jgi:dTDP-4-dehydrorhamnose 3,5-epimerase
MKFNKTNILDCTLVQSEVYKDRRGSFTKIFHNDLYSENSINISFKEQFFTRSNRNVLRGMHFQIPPYDAGKLVTCIYGSVLDVVLDLRKGSPSFGKFDTIELTPESGLSIYIPNGVAHGFLSLQKDSILMYSTSSIYAPKYDSGIRWDSFGYNWPSKEKFNISERDKKMIKLPEFKTPFVYPDDK